MRRTTLTFRLSGPEVQRDLVHEFALHHDVVVSANGSDGAHMITVETAGTPAALWDVRATVGMFDDNAQELGHHR